MKLDQALTQLAETFADMVADKVIESLQAKHGELSDSTEEPAEEPKKSKQAGKGKKTDDKPAEKKEDKPAEKKEDKPAEKSAPEGDLRKECRSLLASLANKNRAKAVETLGKYGVKRMPEVPEEKLADLMSDLETALEAE